MIAHIAGKLIQKQPNSVIVDVGGVGYELTVPLSTFYDLGEIGADVSLRAYTYVREDALQLFGFRTDREKQLFLLLTSVSGVGPKLAITLLSGMNADDLIRAVRDNNLARLTNIPGVGKKTAERLVVELRDKVAKLSVAAQAEPVQSDYMAVANALSDDIVSALVNLGYQKAAAEKAVGNVFKENADASFETALKLALRALAR
ncbi:MAG: Holliday junction branch migration protein RuvA [Acidobacteria bacterium]|nr:Holliday junction branch migration protein RuvA [Acidobacteriota bacterium]MBI3424401.1 Holliday junction branch migration protein RuvA [Acidobacteriota bacterium]